MKAYQNNPETRLALLEQSINTINETLKRLETKIDNNHIQLTNQNIQLTNQNWAHFKWLLTFIIALFGFPIIQNIITHFWSR